MAAAPDSTSQNFSACVMMKALQLEGMIYQYVHRMMIAFVILLIQFIELFLNTVAECGREKKYFVCSSCQFDN